MATSIRSPVPLALSGCTISDTCLTGSGFRSGPSKLHALASTISVTATTSTPRGRRIPAHAVATQPGEERGLRDPAGCG